MIPGSVAGGQGKPEVTLVLSGGVALGAYQAGAYAAFHEQEPRGPAAIAGTSVGAVNGALILGNAPADRVTRLRQFWEEAATDVGWPLAGWGTAGRQADSMSSILSARLLGRPGLFRPRAPGLSQVALYENKPLAAKLKRLLDFERLNDGAARFCVVATDVRTGEEVRFDTRLGARIGPEHVLASCGFLPEFPVVEIDGRPLADGGLVANTPLAAALAGNGAHDSIFFVVELFCVEGAAPGSLDEGIGRRLDLLFGNQTRQMLGALEREHQLRRDLAARAGGTWPSVTVLHLRYRAPRYETGMDKMFNFSRATLHERWDAGYADMREALRLVGNGAVPGSGSRGVQFSRWPGVPASPAGG